MAEEEKMKFLEKLIKNGVKIGNFIMDNHGTMNLTNQMEAENKDILLQFQDDYPGVTNTDNVSDIIAAIRKKKDQKE